MAEVPGQDSLRRDFTVWLKRVIEWTEEWEQKGLQEGRQEECISLVTDVTHCCRNPR